MHSADYAVARCLSVRPSICLSHAGILSKRLYILVSSLFVTIGYLCHSSFFANQTVWQYFARNPLTYLLYFNEGIECKGYEKIDIFDQYFASSRKWYTIQLYLQWSTNRMSYYVLSNGAISVDLDWLSEILNDTKHLHRAVSLRQLSFLYYIAWY